MLEATRSAALAVLLVVLVAGAGSAAEPEAAIDVRCSAETGVEVSLDHGRHAAGSQRRLASEAGGSVPYTIYTDAARSQAWDAAAVIGKVEPEQALRLIAYGRIEPRAVQAWTGMRTACGSTTSSAIGRQRESWLS